MEPVPPVPVDEQRRQAPRGGLVAQASLQHPNGPQLEGPGDGQHRFLSAAVENHSTWETTWQSLGGTPGRTGRTHCLTQLGEFILAIVH